MPQQAKRLVLACALAVFATAGRAQAHAMLANPHAEAGTFYKAQVAITHGCAGSATHEVIIRIPAGVQGAKPMPKPGWNIEVTRAPLAQPRQSHGRTIADDVTSIRFYGGSLPNDEYDEFTVVATLPEQEGPLYWPVTQVCERGRNEWTEVPAPGQPTAVLKSPAPRLDLMPAEHAMHHHHE